MAAKTAATPRPRAKGTRPQTPKRRATTVGSTGAEKRRVVVYLPAPLARRLRLHCADADTDVSGYVAGLLATALKGRKGRS
jgi:hypothetical protein